MSNRPAAAAWPAEVPGQAGDVRVGRVAGAGARGAPVTRIPDELRVEDPRAWPARRIRREYGDHWPDPAAVRCRTQVRDRLGGDVRCRGDLAAVANPQALPVQPADAPRAVPPGDACAEGQLSRGMPVAARRLDLAAHVPQPPVRRARAILAVEQRDEPLGASQQAVQGERVIARERPAWQHTQPGGEAGPGCVRRQRASPESREHRGILALRLVAGPAAGPAAAGNSPAGPERDPALIQVHADLRVVRLRTRLVDVVMAGAHQGSCPDAGPARARPCAGPSRPCWPSRQPADSAPPVPALPAGRTACASASAFQPPFRASRPATFRHRRLQHKRALPARTPVLHSA